MPFFSEVWNKVQELYAWVIPILYMDQNLTYSGDLPVFIFSSENITKPEVFLHFLIISGSVERDQ